VKFAVTTRGAILGSIAFLFMALQIFSKVSSGQWPLIFGIVAALGAALLCAGVAVAAPSPTAGSGLRFRNTILQWLGFAIVFLVMFQILDMLHVDYRQYFH